MITDTGRRADVAVYGPEGRLQLVAEVKNHHAKSPQWAARTLRNMVAHGLIPPAPYLMMVTADAILLWDNRDGRIVENLNLADEGVEPDYRADAGEVLEDYLEGSQISAAELSEEGLTMMLTSWLTEVMNSANPDEYGGSRVQWLVDSGLYEAIRGGTLATRAPA